jgi:hypothetical protein
VLVVSIESDSSCVSSWTCFWNCCTCSENWKWYPLLFQLNLFLKLLYLKWALKVLAVVFRVELQQVNQGMNVYWMKFVREHVCVRMFGSVLGWSD